MYVHATVAAGLTNMHLRANSQGDFPFAPTQTTAARATKATKRWQGGSRHEQPAPNLFLQSTVKIPAERQLSLPIYHNVTVEELREDEAKANRRNLHLHSGGSTAQLRRAPAD